MSVRISQELRDRLKIACIERGVSMNERVIDLIERDLAQHEREKQEAAKKRRK